MHLSIYHFIVWLGSSIFNFILWLGIGLISSLVFDRLRNLEIETKELLGRMYPGIMDIIDRSIAAIHLLWFMRWRLLYVPVLIVYPCAGIYQTIFGAYTGILIINELISRCLSFCFWALLAAWLVPQGIAALKINLGAKNKYSSRYRPSRII